VSRKQTDTYSASVTRLKALVGRLESAQVDVDELESVVKESVELVTVCRARLRATQTSVDALLTGLQDDAAATVPRPGTAAGVPVTGDACADAPAQSAAVMLRVSTDDDFDPFAEE
jgi:exodeoxyribonuclease VII small subunit